MTPQIANLTRTVVAVDNFLANPDELRRFALGLEYREDLRYYRGRRSTTRLLWPGLKEAFEGLLNRRVTLWEGHGTNGVFQYCVGGDQIVYHSDEQRYAGAIYLTPNAPPPTGTTLIRSSVTKGRTAAESKALGDANGTDNPIGWYERQMYAGKLLDGTAWEPVDNIGNVYNRLVLWDARMAHHATAYFGDNLTNARLFQLFFFDAE